MRDPEELRHLDAEGRPEDAARQVHPVRAYTHPVRRDHLVHQDVAHNRQVRRVHLDVVHNHRRQEDVVRRGHLAHRDAAHNHRHREDVVRRGHLAHRVDGRNRHRVHQDRRRQVHPEDHRVHQDGHQDRLDVGRHDLVVVVAPRVGTSLLLRASAKR